MKGKVFFFKLNEQETKGKIQEFAVERALLDQGVCVHPLRCSYFSWDTDWGHWQVVVFSALHLSMADPPHWSLFSIDLHSSETEVLLYASLSLPTHASLSLYVFKPLYAECPISHPFYQLISLLEAENHFISNNQIICSGP